MNLFLNKSFDRGSEAESGSGGSGEMPSPEMPDAFSDLRTPNAFSDPKALKDAILSCRRCALCETVTNKVIMKGSLCPKIVFIGEAPGKNEDLSGIPFCGRAGKLLDEMIGHMGLSPEDWAVINTVKCRPPNNRVPSKAEMAACRPFFDAQLSLLSPRLIILLGNTAEKAYGGASLKAEWGVPFKDDSGRTVLKIFHPAALIYQRNRIPDQYAFLDRNRGLWES